MSDYLDALRRVIDEIVTPAAADIDHKGRFPREAVDALGRAGILGLASSADVGGRGL
ncbi:MAG: acyl-CoA dehydrogenase family protein, partial [Actinomycetota bacterium]|nr:acyl-CoA dehydrogenase family protein [Actinomycetota bacterium]